MAKNIIPEQGAWATLVALINGNFTEVYQHPNFGVYDYNDLATQTIPIDIAVADTWYPITNDGEGDATNTVFALPGLADIWDTSSDSFDFSGLLLGDTVDIRLDLEVTSTSINQDFDIDLVLGLGQAGEYRIPFFIEKTFKSVASRQLIRFNGVYIGDMNTKDFPAEFQIRSSDTGSVKVNGWYVRVNTRAQEVV